MIDPKELRISNWVHQIGGNNLQVITINEIGISGRGEINGWEDKDFDPIPLTPEALEKAGFTWKPNVFRWVYNDPYFMMVEDNLGFQTAYGNGDFIQPYITSLHQLQNTFYYLTGTELKVDI